MELRALRVHQRLYVLVPIGLVFCNTMWETQNDPSAKAVRLSVGLGMICSSGQVYNAHMNKICCKKFPLELLRVVDQEKAGIL